jgi:hypothetical protein
MTPATVVGMAKLAGAQLVAVTDHNSALNLPAAQAAAQAYGIKLLPGIEVNTQEEIHLLCYFSTVEKALELGEKIFAALPAFPYDPLVWGRQIVMDENDLELYTVERLLTGAVAIDIYAMKAMCEAMGGIAVPAHTEKDSYSLLSVMGFCPEDLDFAAYEMANPEKYPELAQRGFLQRGREILCSSDAHNLEDIGGRLRRLAENSVLKKLL